MTRDKLPAVTARRIALAAQGFGIKRPDGATKPLQKEVAVGDMARFLPAGTATEATVCAEAEPAPAMRCRLRRAG